MIYLWSALIYAHILEHPDFPRLYEASGMAYLKEHYHGHLHCLEQQEITPCLLTTETFTAYYNIAEDAEHRLYVSTPVRVTQHGKKRTLACPSARNETL